MGELVALLPMVTLPVALPVEEGARVTFNVALCPAAIVCPEYTPLALKPAPETLTLEIVTPELPKLVTVADKVRLLPIVTLPKPKLDGLAARLVDAVLTVSTAPLLVTVPIVLLTLTLNCAPLSAIVDTARI